MEGRAAELPSWVWAALRTTARQPGFLGGGLLVDGKAEWHVVHRFDTEDTARTWKDSLARAQWAAPAEGLARECGRRTVAGTKAWFDSRAPGSATPAASRPPPTPPPPPPPPPKWKLWFVNKSAIFPPVLLFHPTVLHCLGSLAPLIRTLLLCLCVTALVTWILTPRVQHFLKKWLYPPLQALRGRHERRTA